MLESDEFLLYFDKLHSFVYQNLLFQNFKIGQNIPILGGEIALARTFLRLIYGKRILYVLLTDM